MPFKMLSSRLLLSSGTLAALCLLAAAQGVMGAGVPAATPAFATSFAFDRNNAFGWRFTPVRDINILELGFFDSSSLPGGTSAGLAQAHTVGIFRVSDSNLLASVSVPAGTLGELDGHFRYVPLASSLRLTGGVTYVVVAFVLSASPDQLGAATNWPMAPEIVYANSLLPTASSPTFGTSQYLFSAHGSTPAGLAYPGVPQSQILPTFAANFKFAPLNPARPLLTISSIQRSAIALTMTDLTVGTVNYVEKSSDLQAWRPVTNFVASTTTTNMTIAVGSESQVVYRLHFQP